MSASTEKEQVPATYTSRIDINSTVCAVAILVFSGGNVWLSQMSHIKMFFFFQVNKTKYGKLREACGPKR